MSTLEIMGQVDEALSELGASDQEKGQLHRYLVRETSNLSLKAGKDVAMFDLKNRVGNALMRHRARQGSKT